jgi:hypothetical protein
MRQASRIFLLLSISVLLAGCKLAVIVVEGGEVQSIGSGTCVARGICIVDVSDPSFSETFEAVPRTGWHFLKWHSGDKFFCAGSIYSRCDLSFKGHEESEAVADMVASSEVFYLMPVFKRISNVITVNGKEWLQPALFLELSWDQINAVCPAPSGVCRDNETLNGYDMTGWTWASIDDAKALFNVYLGDNILNSETGFYADDTGAISRFYEDGWLPTFEGDDYDNVVMEWRAMLRNVETVVGTRREPGMAITLTGYLEWGGPPAKALEGRFIAALRGSVDGYYRVGALFYR